MDDELVVDMREVEMTINIVCECFIAYPWHTISEGFERDAR